MGNGEMVDDVLEGYRMADFTPSVIVVILLMHSLFPYYIYFCHVVLLLKIEVYLPGNN